jgi:hypothetical protein
MADLLAPLNRLAQTSPSLIAKPAGTFQINEQVYQQERALVAALQTILAQYQKLMAYAPNL